MNWRICPFNENPFPVVIKSEVTCGPDEGLVFIVGLSPFAVTENWKGFEL